MIEADETLPVSRLRKLVAGVSERLIAGGARQLLEAAARESGA
jgi:hypothetical protein